MSIYKKKTWSDPVVEAANRAETPKEQALREILRGIFVIKDNPDLNPKYTGDENTDAILAHRARAIRKIMDNTIRDLQDNYEPPELIWDYLTDKNKPRLRIALEPSKQMFSNLVKNLQDPEWVSALCQCPECRKFLLSNTKWAKKGNKFCSPKCNEKYYGHKRKKNKSQNNPNKPNIVECPGNFESITVTATECLNANEKNIRGFFDDCPNKKNTCPHLKKGGNNHGNI